MGTKGLVMFQGQELCLTSLYTTMLDSTVNGGKINPPQLFPQKSLYVSQIKKCYPCLRRSVLSFPRKHSPIWKCVFLLFLGQIKLQTKIKPSQTFLDTVYVLAPYHGHVFGVLHFVSLSLSFSFLEQYKGHFKNVFH